MEAGPAGYVRALMVLGRVSNLPTVWSNCLAGWLLAGGMGLDRLALVCAGGTCLYLGGMFLNDAFDAEFDRQHRRGRPIPSGAISETEVWEWGVGWLVAGMLPLLMLGEVAVWVGMGLVGVIVLYDWLHKRVAWSPVLMAGCRVGLYMLAGVAGSGGLDGLSIWSGLALGGYVTGLSYLARREATGADFAWWPVLLMLAPWGLAWLVNGWGDGVRVWVGMAMVGLWVIRSVRFTFWVRPANISRTVSGLLAGIVLVDFLAVLPQSIGVGLVFLLLFGLALWCQRHVPAT